MQSVYTFSTPLRSISLSQYLSLSRKTFPIAYVVIYVYCSTALCSYVYCAVYLASAPNVMRILPLTNRLSNDV